MRRLRAGGEIAAGNLRTRTYPPAPAGTEHRSTTLSAAPLADAPVAAGTTASTTFADLGVPSAVVRNLADRGITSAFPIQVATLPDALAGRDVCGKAPTGSGKTIAFGIPLVTGLGKARPRRPRGLVLVPTRELATQVHEEIRALAGPGGATSATFFGGVGFGSQIKALHRGIDIAVACPGRLADLIQQGEMNLSEVRMVVLDEADRMADMGFLPEVKRILDRTPDDRQTLLFSATLDGDVDVLIRRYQKDPVRHEHVVEDDRPQNRHEFWAVERDQRLATTARLTKAEWPAVVFVRTKRGADRVAKQLTREGVAAAAIHGDRSQGQRERALAAFTSGRVQALVATDVAARGIHVDGVACVVHYDMPPDHKDFVHRSGRTGRAGATGLVVSLVPGDQVRDVKKMQKVLDMPVGVHPSGVDQIGPERTPPPVAPGPALDGPSTGGRRRPQGGGRSRNQAGGGSRNGQGRNRSGGGGGRGRKPAGARSGGGNGRSASGRGRGGR
ncbi:DEAD/DEAH box helicase [Actinomarinicola tropica]|uniref:DEAD/DEAH box helicase n=1 Tax=Actinomarinicola tropica TaxID=2789776 RepID=A0A5Q2RLS1_9ACTN|nr:DEAD/DEAH box helicase [Actinomarinicola tropica]QGG96783.1 DEAD/DEAH box helicase [Actinomarinicola tropica]